MDSILFPLRAIRYQTSHSQDLSSVMTPPYDVISPALRDELFARDEHNFVRVELPGAGEAADGGDARYARAAATLREWLAEGVLMREELPAVYVLEQEFRHAGRLWRRRGAFALVRLPEPGDAYVLSHEGTLAGPKADRLRLMQACQAMTSPIMVMSEDPEGRLSAALSQVGGQPDVVAEDADGVTHRMWVVADESVIGAARAAVGQGPLFIADGHHRFETALTYRDAMRASTPQARPEAAFNHALVLVTSASDEGLKILAAHRLVSGLGADGVAQMKARMRQWFDLNAWPLPDPGALGGQPWLDGAAPDRHVFGAYCGDGQYYVLTARDGTLPKSTSPVASLDVNILHRNLVEPVIVSLGDAPELTYVIDEHEAASAVARGEHDFAFFLRPTRVADVMAAARAGERMPGKSTYFYPKAPAGLVISDASADPI